MARKTATIMVGRVAKLTVVTAAALAGALVGTSSGIALGSVAGPIGAAAGWGLGLVYGGLAGEYIADKLTSGRWFDGSRQETAF